MNQNTTELKSAAEAGQFERLVMLITVVMLMTGCADEGITKARGETRRAAFKECMELAAKLERKADNDVSDIVSECESHAYYSTNYI